MKKFIIMMILSFGISHILHLFFSEENSGLKKSEKKIFKVMLEQGVIGCITQEHFDLVQKLYQQKEEYKIKSLISSKKCFIFKKDDEFEGLDNYCTSDDFKENKMFSSKKFLLTKIILPCFALD